MLRDKEKLISSLKLIFQFLKNQIYPADTENKVKTNKKKMNLE